MLNKFYENVQPADFLVSPRRPSPRIDGGGVQRMTWKYPNFWPSLQSPGHFYYIYSLSQ